MGWTHRDSTNLERIANAFEEFVKLYQSNTNPPTVLDVWNEHQSRHNTPKTLEADFFLRITQVYIDEEVIKREKGLKRKSAVRVSRNLTTTVTDFFEEQAPDFYFQNDDAYILLNKNGETIALLRFYTDIGFYRAGAFYDEMKKVAQYAQQIGVSLDHVFVIIGSLMNSLEAFHVKSILGPDAPDNAVLLTDPYRSQLEDYLKTYVSGVTALPNPLKQIFFLAANTHPNVAAWEFTNESKALPLNSNWLRPSITQIVDSLKNF